MGSEPMTKTDPIPPPSEGYPASWVRVSLRVSPSGEIHAIGGDRDGDEGDCQYPGLDRINARIHAAEEVARLRAEVERLSEENSECRTFASTADQMVKDAEQRIATLTAERDNALTAYKILATWHERDGSVGGCEVAFEEAEAAIRNTYLAERDLARLAECVKLLAERDEALAEARILRDAAPQPPRDATSEARDDCTDAHRFGLFKVRCYCGKETRQPLWSDQ